MMQDIPDSELVEIINHIIQTKTVIKPKLVISHLKKDRYIENETSLRIRLIILFRVLVEAEVLQKYSRHNYIVLEKDIDIPKLINIFKDAFVIFDETKSAYSLHVKSRLSEERIVRCENEQ